jgi:hypothetical protein
VSVIESTGGHSNGISRRVFVQSGQNTGRFPHHVRHEPRPLAVHGCDRFSTSTRAARNVTMSTAPLTLRTV